ncbi:OLC1v1001322C1 [Oldenlandia corymbosa var. corymbosa]|uniref:OLC1v1001322C1 n=1 Tax=Oldenlandia corymbosa var. corymbosa TaxID=529605 RepID=A0AAV1D7S7_OLDCO|nr:OLC1v1001322C1 [Oldenlandia corymbosa var. corymbosa]
MYDLQDSFKDFGGYGEDYSILFATDEGFSEKDDVVAWVKGMGMANGMIINVVSSKRKNAVLMRCYKGGKVSVDDGEYYVTSNSKTQITRCKFKLYVHLVDGKWRIRVYPDEFGMHNHELFDEDHPTRGLSDGVKQLMQGMSKDGSRLCQIMTAIERIFPNKQVNRRYKLEYSRQKIGTHYCSFPLNRLKCQVSHTYLQKLYTEWSKAQEWKEETNDRCDHVVYWTCRIPCVCALKKAADAGTSITLKHIHPFWVTVNIGEQAGTSAPSDVDDDVLYTRQLMEELNECPKAVRRTVNRALHDIMHPDQCGFKQPKEVKRRKERSKGAKSKKKVTSDTLAHEQSP